MTAWKYTDATNTVVFRTLDNGGMESCLVSALPEGNTPEPADPPAPVVIASVTMRQARLALLAAGLLDDVATAIAGIADAGQRQATEIEWEYAQEVRRDHLWVQNLATSMGLDLDVLFEQAAAL